MLGWVVIAVLVICAAVWSWMVFMGNAMSDSPGGNFQGLWWIVGAWAIVVGAVVYKIFG
jgi:hypothetical protein